VNGDAGSIERQIRTLEDRDPDVRKRSEHLVAMEDANGFASPKRLERRGIEPLDVGCAEVRNAISVVSIHRFVQALQEATHEVWFEPSCHRPLQRRPARAAGEMSAASVDHGRCG
jgi:hypothetical protein